mmetsp:Transcript_27179/g.71304  ORF Transcript_27179/g.71304 Transcript_27179/m.71304 type:complete len:204 (-) Transcript_27179:320-931(-)
MIVQVVQFVKVDVAFHNHYLLPLCIAIFVVVVIVVKARVTVFVDVVHKAIDLVVVVEQRPAIIVVVRAINFFHFFIFVEFVVILTIFVARDSCGGPQIVVVGGCCFSVWVILFDFIELIVVHIFVFFVVVVVIILLTHLVPLTIRLIEVRQLWQQVEDGVGVAIGLADGVVEQVQRCELLKLFQRFQCLDLLDPIPGQIQRLE